MSRPQDYTVAWICAVSTERVAAEAFLDEEHELPTSVSPHDNNSYKLGKVGRHMVVIAVLPDGEYGTSSAACVARDLLHSFPNVRIGLMVGIGGGAPSQKHDIRLGDIVVGTTRGGKSGVLRYDFGKAIQNQPLEMVGFMNQAPPSLRTAVSGLKSHYEGNGHTIQEAVEKALAKKPRLRKRYKLPGHEHDRLYQSHIIHQDGSCPEHCGDDETVLVARTQRTEEDDDPTIHYGIIASANKLMKDASIRDRLARDHDVLCFEMEAAGLMNHFPCLIIRGICDYSDTHKNDQWQGYAAMVAAAYAKDLLLQIVPSSIEKERKIADILSELEGSVNNVIEELKPVSKIIHSKHERDILEWLTSHDCAITHKDTFTKAEPGTGQWFIYSQEFETWLNYNNRNLLCLGNPGAGKTVITSMVVNHLLSEFGQTADVGIAYVYCNYQRRTQQGATDILSSILRQLAQARSPLPMSVQDLYKSHERFRTHPTLEQVSEAIFSVAAEYSKVFIIIDALDECNASNNTRATILGEMFRLQMYTTANIFVTSRPNKEVSRSFSGSPTMEIAATDGDIQKYLDRQISIKKSVVIDDALRAEIKDRIVTAANGMFLLASLQTGTVLGQPTKGDLLETLETLNKGELGLDDHYRQAMYRIQDQEPKRKALAMKILIWIVHAKRPLFLRELQHALAVRKGAKELDQNFIPHPEIILSLCAGLVVLDEESTVVRLVHYTTQEYFEREHEQWFETAESYLAMTCVTYLSLKAFDNISPTVVDDRRLMKQLREYPFYDYSARHWGHHARSGTTDLNDFLLCFLTCEAHVNACASISMQHIMFTPPPKITGIHLVAYFGLWSLAACLFDNGFAADEPDSHGRTPLSYAAESGHETVVKLLLARDDVHPDSSSNMSGITRQTPLMFAINNGRWGIVDLLLEQPNFGIDGPDRGTDTPLGLAVKFRNKAVVSRLLEKGADPEKENGHGETALSIAAENGDVSMALFLIENGANPSPRPKRGCGRPPLAYAAIEGHETIVKLLLGIEGIMIDARDYLGKSPLIYAAEYGHEGIARLLLERGANPELRYTWQPRGSALHLAARGGHAGVVTLLLKRGVDPDPVDDDNRTPFSYTAETGRVTVAKLLLATGKVNPDSSDGGRYILGRTPISYAAEGGHESIVELLLRTCGVDPDSKVNVWDGIKTPLVYAVLRGRTATVKLLLDTSRVDPDLRTSAGVTPLFHAAQAGHDAIVMLLLDTGKVSINSISKMGKTPLDVTQEKSTKSLLRERGAKYAKEL